MQNRKAGEELEINHGQLLSLARERFGIHWLVDNAMHDVMANMDHKMQADAQRQAMLHSLETSILTMDEDEFVASWPSDWWQALRQRWFPASWLSRHPVQMTHRREKKYGKVFLSVFPDRTTKFQGSRANYVHFDGTLLP